MNEGLVLLAGWAQWLALVGLLLGAVARRVRRVHDTDERVLYRRRDADRTGWF